MKILLKYLTVVMMLFSTAAAASAGVEKPETCRQCGMDRDVSATSRLLITYADGSIAGVCSLPCAVAEMGESKKEVSSLKAADYWTKELIDARTATWVVGGTKRGVMSSQGIWAFGTGDGARRFVREYGGRTSSFEQALNAVYGELRGGEDAGHGHSHDHDGHGGHGSRLETNPAFGDDIYHTHPAGMWMTSYKFMHMSMNGLRDGTTDIPVERVTPMGSKPYGYMMAPTSMTMDMHMFMVMYGVTDRLTLMGMANYLSNTMEMVMNMGGGNMREPDMKTSGFGDTEVRGIYRINKYLVGSLGLSLPTGDINQEFQTMGMTFRAPYGMQLGSGTFDLKPALTFNLITGDGKWNLGGQAMYTYHAGENKNDYSLGDSVKVTGWVQRALGPFAAWLRLAYHNTGRIHGEDPEIRKSLLEASSPDASPHNYGGRRLDGFIGVNYAKGPFSFGVEAGMPFYQYVNGLQMKTDWFVTSGFQAMF